ncbi:hypothetical protein Tco_0294032 [Tanacetum coccineum]
MSNPRKEEEVNDLRLCCTETPVGLPYPFGNAMGTDTAQIRPRNVSLALETFPMPFRGHAYMIRSGGRGRFQGLKFLRKNLNGEEFIDWFNTVDQCLKVKWVMAISL